MTTLPDYVVTGALYRRDTDNEAQVGDQVKLYLDTDAIPGFPEFVVGVIQTPITKVQCNLATSYNIEYDEADLLGAVDILRVGHVIDAVSVSAAEVLADALDEEIEDREAAVAAEIAARIADVNAEEARAIAAEEVLQDNIDAEEAARIAADDLLQIRPIEGNDPPDSYAVGQAQIERLTPTGTLSGSGNALVIVKHEGLSGSPRAYDVPVTSGWTMSQVVDAVIAELMADSDLTDLFSLTDNGANFDLTTLAVGGLFPANDPLAEITISDGTSTGLNTVVSTNQQVGSATVVATDPEHIGRWYRAGATAPYDWYQAETLTTWRKRFHREFPVTPVLVVGSLPAASSANAGSRAVVTDANATTFNSVVAAGGSNKVPVFSDGTNWKIG